MTSTWKEVRAKRVKTPEAEARIAQAREAMVAELHLAGLRRHRKASQADVAERMVVSQANVSQIERGDVKLSTLAGYVDALGGKLEVHAVFKDERVPLSGSIKNGKLGRESKDSVRTARRPTRAKAQNAKPKAKMSGKKK